MMTENATFYPPSPVNVPKNFTKLPTSYKLKAFLAILAVILFFVLYTSLVVAMGYLFYYALIYDMGRINKLTIILKIGAVAGAGMLLAFTLKFIFQLKNVQPENRIKVDLEKNPKLKDFVSQICKETGAPKPKHVYVDPDVNAYVSYSNMWLSLFLPTRKNLTIGFGLVSCLTMTEFKAVVAHEFGHFAQRSMKIGSYIISANTIIHGMIYNRDSWDNALEKWRGSDLRLAAAAWIITPVIWIIRQVLALFYQFLNLVYSSLSREMEFNADKVAISTTGSDAIVSSLWKLDHGAGCWNETVNHAYLASQKEMYVGNMYVHNDFTFAQKSEVIKEDLANLEADERGGKRFFESSEHSKVGMYASHPPNDLREHNAKTPYLSCDMDDRSAWLLFDTKEVLQKKLTQLVYEQYMKKTPTETVTEKDFKAFIEAESAGKELLEEYHNTFQDRFVHLPVEQDLVAASASITADVSELQLLKKQLLELMAPVKDLENKLVQVQEIASGTSAIKSFTYNSYEYKKKEMPTVYEKIINDRNDLFLNSFKEWDQQFFAIHYKIAKDQNKHEELGRYYLQHKMISNFYEYLVSSRATIYKDLQTLQSQSELTEFQVSEASNKVKRMFMDFNDGIEKFTDLVFMPLPNIDSEQELKNAIVTRGRFTDGMGNIFNTGRFDSMMQELELAISHLQRIDQRSIATILQYHHQLVEQMN